jgi:hypothetical protein
MRAEDEEKHAQALRSRGYAEPEAHEPAAEAPDAVVRPAPDATSTSTEAAGDEEDAASEASPALEPEEAEAPAQDDPYAAQRAVREEAERYASLPIDPQARQIWQSTLERIQPKVSSSAFTTWFSGTRGLALEDETLIVRVESSFGREHLEQRFYDLIASAVSEQRGTETKARFIVVPDAQDE